MGNLKVGDIVARKSYGKDILFKVAEVIEEGDNRKVILRGVMYRIEADAPEDDLVVLCEEEQENYKKKDRNDIEKSEQKTLNRRAMRNYPKEFFRSTPKEEPARFSVPGRILHLDGDSEYMEKCLEEYKKLGLTAYGEEVAEKDQPSRVRKLLEKYYPDILVLTGHDGVIKGDKGFANISNYRHSRYFIEAVREARKYIPSRDELVIFAGACQSFYEGILAAGANFASAPYRVLIHALDPVFVCEKIALLNIDRTITANEVVESTITGVKGIGGVQTRGKYREGYPKPPVTAEIHEN